MWGFLCWLQCDEKITGIREGIGVHSDLVNDFRFVIFIHLLFGALCLRLDPSRWFDDDGKDSAFDFGVM